MRPENETVEDRHMPLFQEMKTGPTHEEKVDRIAKQLKERKDSAPASLKKNVVSHQVPKPKDRKYSDHKIPIGSLNEIIDIDPDSRTCVAEPVVTYADLVDATMRFGLAPMIVPEFRTITIGGAVAGCSIESMSFKYGGFHDTCEEYEVITAKGDVLHCTPDNENSLLFHMMHGTFGTLGIIAKLKFKLIPVKPFVRVRFNKYHDLSDFKDAIWYHFSEKDTDFMDAFIHSPDEYVINTGDFVDEVPYIHDYGWKRVFCESSKKGGESFLRTPEYFFRYDRGVTRGRFISSNHTLELAEKLHSLIPIRLIPITMDLFIPFSRVDEFIDWHKTEVAHFPLWCVPYKKARNYEWLSEEFTKKTKDNLFLDLAIYGMKNKNKRKNYYRLMEEELKKIGGMKTLISNNYYSESEFWKIWNKENFYKVKNRTDPDNIFRDLYTKTCRTSMGQIA